MEYSFLGRSVFLGGSYVFMFVTARLFPVHMKILVGDVTLGDVFRVRRDFIIQSLPTLCASSFVYHLSLQQHAISTFHWQQ